MPNASTEFKVKLPEIQQIEKRIAELRDLVDVEVLAYSEGHGYRMPVYKLNFGSKDPQAPVLGIIGGVHGLERIGAQVSIALLNSLSELILWDRGIQETLQEMRIFFIPTVNPIGIHRKTRSNPRGVDLMRNAPVDGQGRMPYLVSGHRYSSRLPWYRGDVHAMEIEAQAMVDAVGKEIKQSRLAVTVDLHSGFGFQDRIWIPYAKSVEPFPDLAYAHSFKSLLDKTYPNHFYRYEPQAKNYTTHGDLWDHLYDEYKALHKGTASLKAENGAERLDPVSRDAHFALAPAPVYLPLCLEMGSWIWVKKNPWQLFSWEGPYNPLKGHRHQRTLRRHNTLFEFLIRAVHSRGAWADLSPEQLVKHRTQAEELWYHGR